MKRLVALRWTRVTLLAVTVERDLMAPHRELSWDMMSDQLTRYRDVKHLLASLAQEVVVVMLIGSLIARHVILKSHDRKDPVLDALTHDSVDRREANFRSER